MRTVKSMLSKKAINDPVIAINPFTGLKLTVNDLNEIAENSAIFTNVGFIPLIKFQRDRKLYGLWYDTIRAHKTRK